MKRFYKSVAVEPVKGGFALLLDRRPVKTPGRTALILPSAAMSRAVADEWEGQGEEIVISTMPMTGFANAAIDRIAPDPARFVSDIAAYGETDTLCYRADPGDPLAAKQEHEWEPILRWAENRYDIRLIRVAGIVHQPQAMHSLSRLTAVVRAFDPFTLAGLSTIASIGGSLISALAMLENAYAPDVIWRAVCLEELWQEDLWGADAEAEATRALRRTAFDDAYRFCCIARGISGER
ncbi:ATP12 family chaperone protein [Blastomonas aquatica]|uniref:ATPase n=1 Tax=Blastomonas aquatica TaxID=1510276 RepID=A0ABQ1JJ09_9SPHN|nr:ATP12 family protein [Blastomonas aquatica]GGB68401.1 ATPase [Blastomonas aquatica]